MKKEQRSTFVFSVFMCLIFIALFVMMLPVSDWIDESHNVYSGEVTELIVDKGDYAFIYFSPENGESEILLVKDPLKSLVLRSEIPSEFTFKLKSVFSFQEYHQYRRVVDIRELE